MANGFRSDLSVNREDPLDALNLRISGVEVFAASQAELLDEACAQYLLGPALNEWFEMNVPRDVTDDTWAILRNDGHSIERQRVTYLEECRHILLGHKLIRIAKTGDAYGRTYDSPEEHDAHFLASACLLPDTNVRDFVKAGKSAKDIAAQFGTSMEMAEYRIKHLGLWRAYQKRSIDMQG